MNEPSSDEMANTPDLEIGKDARQGCIVSPRLFVTYTEKWVRYAETSETSFGITLGGKTISNLRYADDTALIENCKHGKEALEHLAKNVEEVEKQLNLNSMSRRQNSWSLKAQKNRITLMVKKLSKLRVSRMWAQRSQLQKFA